MQNLFLDYKRFYIFSLKDTQKGQCTVWQNINFIEVFVILPSNMENCMTGTVENFVKDKSTCSQHRKVEQCHRK